MSYSNFGKPFTERSSYIRDAIKILDRREVSFEYDGEMGANVAVNENLIEPIFIGDEKEILKSDKNYYELHFSNIGGLVMPIILEFTFVDRTTEVIRIPAEIWKKNSKEVKKIFILDKEVANVRLDPFLETADVDLNNNSWPARNEPTRFQIFKENDKKKENPMQRAIRAEEKSNE